jgi:hypothetical protein
MVPRVTAFAVLCVVASVVAWTTPAWPHVGNTSADVVHACVGKDGIVRIVGLTGTCTTKETATHWAIAGSPGQPGAAGAGAIRVVDSVGKEVGILHDGGASNPLFAAGLLVKVDDTTIIRVQVTSLSAIGQNPVFFHTASDCSGQRHNTFGSSSLLKMGTLVAQPDGSLLVAYSAGPSANATIAAREDFSPGADILQPGLCTPFVPSSQAVAPTVFLDLGAYVPPFHFE